MSADARLAAAATAGLLLIVVLVAGVLTAPRLPEYVRAVRGAAPAPGDFTETEHRRGRELRRRLRPLAYGRLLLNLAVAFLLGATPLGGRLVEAVGRPFGGSWFWQAGFGALVLLALSWLVGLPLGVFSERILRAAGLSVQTWSAWALDRVKALVLGAVVVWVLAVAGYALIRHAPDTWWMIAALGAAAFTVLLSFVFPVVVEPLFLKFRSLEAGRLRDDLLALAERDGVPVRDVLVADASRRTTALNAYVSGLGRTRRVVVFDTLVTGASEAEVRLVVAHELGHAAERDVLRGTVLGAAAAAFSTLVVALALSSPTLLELVDASGPADPRAIGLVLLVSTLLGLATGPLSNAVSRRIETRADLHSLELTRDAGAFVASERRLALTNVADLAPSRLAYLLFASHPTVPERIATAREWAERAQVPVPGPLVQGSAVG